MEMLQLRYFYESAQFENFAKVAEKYMVPASSISASIKRLEKELGCSLFDRHSNKIVLNENGRKLQRTLCLIFNELDGTVEELADHKIEKTEYRMLVRAIRARVINAVIDYRKQHSNIVFKIDYDMSTTDYGAYDYIIDEKKEVYDGYERFELCSLKVRFIASVHNPLCGRDVTMSQLCKQSFVTFGPGSNLHNLLVKECKNAGFIPNIAVETNDISCYVRCIRENVGIGLTRSTIKDKTKIDYINVVDFDARQTFYCYYRKQSISPDAQNFIDFLKSREM